MLGGGVSLEVVGELAHQDALWELSCGTVGQRVRRGVVAVLVPEPENPYDPNAIAVQIDGRIIGYLPRAIAKEYLPGLKRLMKAHRGRIGLRGVIVGGGYYDDGPGRLGVWLEHEPADFVASAPLPSTRVGRGAFDGAMRTGLTRALSTEGEDGSSDFSWFADLPQADRPAIARLRELLAVGSDPISRHFQFAELEARLYRSRNLYESALDEYDEACARHDREMEGICEAFLAKWGVIPLLETYRQMAIRQQKKRDWHACQWWTERGLALYGQRAAREEAVEDLMKRRNRAIARLETAEPSRDSRLRQSIPPRGGRRSSAGR
jgi:hypothetical protein